MTWIFLHGLGQAPSAWQPVLRRLEPELTVHCPSLPELGCPVLVLCGSKDRANRKAARELAEQLPQARLHWIAGAGHEANLDSPEVMAELLRSFYQSLS